MVLLSHFEYLTLGPGKFFNWPFFSSHFKGTRVLLQDPVLIYYGDDLEGGALVWFGLEKL